MIPNVHRLHIEGPPGPRPDLEEQRQQNSSTVRRILAVLGFVILARIAVAILEALS